METPQEVAQDRQLDPKGGACGVELRDLAFNYRESMPVLKQVDLSVKPGERVSIIGLEGCGRSTLAQLCAGLLRPQRGLAEVDGLEATRLVRGQLAWFHPSHELLDASVEENVTMGREISQADLRWSLELSGLNDHLSWLPDGLRSELCWAGRNLSSSQVARLQLARALCGRPRLLILDHPLSALDPQARRRMLGRLFDTSRPWTLINLVPDAEALARSQRILWLQDGELLELGPPQQALKLEVSPLPRHFPTICREALMRLEDLDV